MTHIIVIGAGFAGLALANNLKRMKNLKITIIDYKNHHLFQPFLYQVACADLSPSDITVAIRDTFKKYENINVIMDRVTLVDKDNQIIYTENKLSFNYDFLVVATGSETKYFKEEWRQYTLGLKSIRDAINIRDSILTGFERAEASNNSFKKHYYTTFVIIGGGPTGVELAGAMAELMMCTLKSDFSNVSTIESKIILVEAASRLLPSFHPALGDYALASLKTKGVIVKLSTKVNGIKDHYVALSNGEKIKPYIMIWVAGVEATNIRKLLGEDFCYDSAGRIKVEPDLSLPKKPNIFAIGDVARVCGVKGDPLPSLASVAIQEGAFVAQVIRAKLLGGKKDFCFHYKNYGIMAIIGRYHAVAQLSGFIFRGKIAWVIWDLVHIYFLIGFRNRLIVFIKWMWHYFTNAKSERTIF